MNLCLFIIIHYFPAQNIYSICSTSIIKMQAAEFMEEMIAVYKSKYFCHAHSLHWSEMSGFK